MKKTTGHAPVAPNRFDSRSAPFPREQELELYYYLRLTGSLEEDVLPQTSAIVTAVRRLAAY